MARKSGSRAEITGPAIHQAALKLFARSGYAAVSMREIAAEVGVRAGALYLYTPDKQTLLFDLMRAHLERLLAAWNAQKSADSPTEQLRKFVEFHIAYHFGLRDEVLVSHMELRNLSPENLQIVQDLRRSYEQALEDILGTGRRERHFVVHDVRVTTMALMAMLTGYLTWYRDDGRLDKTEIASIYWELTKAMVKA